MAESGLDSLVIEPLENGLNALGLMQGDLAPLKRAGLGLLIGYGIAYGLKPGVAWKGSTERPWKLGKNGGTDGTYLTAEIITVIPAIILGVLI